MKKVNDKKQLVVIFERDDSYPEVTLYYPLSLAFGHIDKEKKRFVTEDGKEYKYFLGTKDKYAYGLRTDFKTVQRVYKGITHQHSLKIYLNILQKFIYYLAMCEDDQVHLVCEDEAGNVTPLDGPEYEAFLNSRAKSYEKKQNQELKKILNQKIDTKTLSKEVKNYVLAQDKAIDNIVTILWENSRSQNKQNMLVIGPTGVGKTEIFRQIAKKIKVPLVEINMAEFTKTGYRGQSIEDILIRLIKASENNIKKAEHGFVILDEIDKKAGNKESGENIGSSSVQDELLKLIEDGTFDVNLGTDIEPNIVTINTKDITFIGLGAFSELFEKDNKQVKTIGFNNKEIKPQSLRKKVTNDDLINYGLKPELVGRFRNIIELNPLSKDNLIQIIKNPNNKILQDKINILKKENIDVEIKEPVYEKIAENAISKKTGARGLHSELDNLFRPAMTKISQNEGIYKKLIINEETVDNSSNYTLIKKKNSNN